MVQARVSPRHDEYRGGHRQLTVGEDERLDVPGQMMNGYDGKTTCPAKCLGKGHADEQRSDKSRTLRDRDGAHIGQRDRRVRERGLDNTADVANVLPGRELGNYAAPCTVDRGLRGDDIGRNAPWPARITCLSDDRGSRLVAGGFDCQ